MVPHAAFTSISNGRAREIVLDIKLSTPIALPIPESSPPQLFNAKTLWDTGATNCAITKTKVDQIGLPEIGKATVCHAGGETIVSVYLLNIFLPMGVVIAMVPATECQSARGNFDFVIGMDIITMGDFALTNFGGKTTVSFIMPPRRTIDYVKEIKPANLTEKLVGRNEPCPCGSGKKYKYCHGA